MKAKLKVPRRSSIKKDKGAGIEFKKTKRITALGVKPIGKVQWNFKAYYLYGAVAPQTGESFWLEFSHLDGRCFQIF